MASNVLAEASPEKRLFISLITRDITLVEALLDLIDNSINAALEPLAEDLKTADDYQTLLENNRIKPKVEIHLKIGSSKISLTDNATGISLDTAQHHVFKFGRDNDEIEASDRLSVYGIGLKRAMFKCGNDIQIISDHKKGGFELELDVQKWAKKKDMPWTLEISPRPPEKTACGTQITISKLYDDVRRRLDDGLFLAQLKERIARTYSFFIGRVIEINVNGEKIQKEAFEIGSNYTSQKFKNGKVSCNITAGIALTSGDQFRDKNAGWFVFCNGRAVLFADKSTTTGWGGVGLPIFQPKHRPFLGTVFFVSSNPEALPWTTTKASVNEESSVWQEAKRHMVTTGRTVINFLDKRYTDEGTDVAPMELQSAAGKKISIFTAATATVKAFSPPKAPPPPVVKVQFDAKSDDLDKIKQYLRKSAMGASAIGKYTFNYFLKNEVREE